MPTAVTGGSSFNASRPRHRPGGTPRRFPLALCLFRREVGEAAYCVTCRGPDQTYLCRVNGEAIGRNDAVELYCVERTAKEGGHASCGARDASAGCNGVEKTYSYNGPDIPEVLPKIRASRS